MARDKTPPPDTTGQVPLWFMTYSDVITLLMTFFILLLTFATSEPEKFEQMQVAVFGGGGGTGFASESKDRVERDALTLRVRPDSSRITNRGSETPSIFRDNANESLGKGLQSLDQPLDHDLHTSRAIKLPLTALVDDNARVTVFGTAMVGKLANHLMKGPFSINLQVVNPDDIKKAIAFSEAISAAAEMPLSRIGVGVRLDSTNDPSMIRVAFTRFWQHDAR